MYDKVRLYHTRIIMKSFIKEFEKFIARGNVLDLAVGVAIGGAFQSIVNSLVNDIIMPIVALITADRNFTELSLDIGDIHILYGNFIQSIVDFLIVAFAIFIVIRNVNKAKELTDKKLKHEQEKKEPEVPKESEELKTLKEIAELLKNK